MGVGDGGSKVGVSVGVGLGVSSGNGRVGVAVGVSVGVAVGVSVGAAVGNSATCAGVGVAKGELSTTIGKFTIFEVGVSSGEKSAVVISGEGVKGTLRLGKRTVTGVLVISGVPVGTSRGISSGGGVTSRGVGVVVPNSAI